MTNARTLKGTTLAAARMDTLGKGFTASAVNVRTISALITKSVCRRQLKSVNAEKVFISTVSPIVSILTSVARRCVKVEVTVTIRLGVMFVVELQL